MAPSIQLLSSPPHHQYNHHHPYIPPKQVSTALLNHPSSHTTCQVKPIIPTSSNASLSTNSDSLGEGPIAKPQFIKPILRTSSSTSLHHSLSAPSLHHQQQHPLTTTQSKHHSASTTSLKSLKFDDSLEKCIYYVSDSPAEVAKSPIFIVDSRENLPALLPDHSQVPPQSEIIVGVRRPRSRCQTPFVHDDEGEVLAYPSSSDSESESDSKEEEDSDGSDDDSVVWMRDSKSPTATSVKRSRTKRRQEWGSDEEKAYLELLNGGARGDGWVPVKKDGPSVPRQPTPWRLTSRSPSTSSRLATGALVAFDTIHAPSPFSTESLPSLTGTILVRNLCFEKHVTVRWTADGWTTSNDTLATFACVVSKGYAGFSGVDKFEFLLPLSVQLLHSAQDSQHPSASFEFAIKVEMDGKVEWDNNSGRNYFVSATRAPKPPKIPTKQKAEYALRVAEGRGVQMEREAREIEREYREGRRAVRELKERILEGERKTWGSGTVYVGGRVSDPPRLESGDWEEICGGGRRRGRGWGWSETEGHFTDIPSTSSSIAAVASSSPTPSPPHSPRAVRLVKMTLAKSPSSSSLSSLSVSLSSPPNEL
ncbi:Protein phosphatase 1 regulatory subunit 3E [Chytridiales sp. JEL 0842]|nr:Protein phosphatase 1 regulatory subunit 3E [Chytridiales sp. JEL 0842]